MQYLTIPVAILALLPLRDLEELAQVVIDLVNLRYGDPDLEDDDAAEEDGEDCCGAHEDDLTDWGPNRPEMMEVVDRNMAFAELETDNEDSEALIWTEWHTRVVDERVADAHELSGQHMP